MKYNETKLTFDDFVNIIKENTGLDMDGGHLFANLSDVCDGVETLNTGFEGHPSFYYYPDLGGKKYVLEENEAYDGSVVYEISEVDEENEYPCQIILRDTVGQWDGDANENIALYGISANPCEADENSTAVKVWTEFYFPSQTPLANNALDRYVRGNEVNRQDASNEAYEAHEFATYQEARDWIDQQEDNTYVLANGELDRPKYTITD